LKRFLPLWAFPLPPPAWSGRVGNLRTDMDRGLGKDRSRQATPFAYENPATLVVPLAISVAGIRLPHYRLQPSAIRRLPRRRQP
jgi:hypothetical protein